MSHNLFNSLQEFKFGAGKTGKYYSLPALEKAGVGKVSRLPVSLRVVLESALRNYDGKKITEAHLKNLANWKPKGARSEEVPIVVARVLLQDMTGVPLVVDFAAMREAAKAQGKTPASSSRCAPRISSWTTRCRSTITAAPDALRKNMEIEFKRNRERYEFLKWSAQAFKTFQIIPPGNGICHQINLEYISQVVWHKGDMCYPDSLVGIDSHTTMVNGLGVLGWGVGGIEAEAAMLGQPMYFLEPDVVGVHLTGKLPDGVTATDLVLKIVQVLRQKKVVGKFVEFFGEGAASLTIPDRATIGNMSPEYGATCGFFPVDDVSCEFLRMTGRGDIVPAVKAYYEAQGMYGMPKKGDIDYSEVVELDLSTDQARGVRSAPPARPPRAARAQRQVPGTDGQSLRRRRLRQGQRNEQAGADQQGGHRRRPRRRADLRDHLVHQHLEPRRAAGRRPARQESGRKRPEAASARQDFARTRLAGRDRISEERRAADLSRAARLLRRRLRLHHLHRQFGPARRAYR